MYNLYESATPSYHNTCNTYLKDCNHEILFYHKRFVLLLYPRLLPLKEILPLLSSMTDTF